MRIDDSSSKTCKINYHPKHTRKRIELHSCQMRLRLGAPARKDSYFVPGFQQHHRRINRDRPVEFIIITRSSPPVAQGGATSAVMFDQKLAVIASRRIHPKNIRVETEFIQPRFSDSERASSDIQVAKFIIAVIDG